MTQTDQIDPILEESSYYHPFSAKELEEMNRSTHFPVDYNQRFEETIKRYETEVEDVKMRFNLSEIPAEMHETFERLYAAQKRFFMEWTHAKIIAPPPSVVGFAGWKNPDTTFEKRRIVEEKAIERITFTEVHFHHVIKHFNHEKKRDQEKSRMEQGFNEAIRYRKAEYAQKFGTEAYELKKVDGVSLVEYIRIARTQHQKLLRFGLQHGLHVPAEIIQDYPKLCAEFQITVDRNAFISSPPSPAEKPTNAAIEKNAICISK